MNHATPLTGLSTAVCKLTCGAEVGTAFFVDRALVITAFHAVFPHFDAGAPINFHQAGNTWIGTVVAHDVDLDVCVLKVERAEEQVLTVTAARKQLNQECHLFGYPYHAQATGLALTGKMVQVLPVGTCDMLIGELNIEGQYDFSGLSGAPVIVDGQVTGIVLRQVDSRIAAISAQKIADFLKSNDVEVKEEELLYTVPHEFQADVESSPDNYNVAAAIQAALLKDGNWVLVHGSPGSGKSTLLASLKPTSPHLVFCGHYFTKIPGDRQPSALRTSATFFLDTLEQLIANILTGEHLPKRDMKQDERLKRLTDLIQELGRFYQEKGQVGVLIVDGLDEVPGLGSFLGILPKTLPTSLKIILSCTSPLVLPAEYRALVHEDQRIEMKPLPVALREAFILSETEALNLPLDRIQQLSVKSEGHPLYMRYLVNYLLTNTFEGGQEEMNQWIASIPAIGGDISRYYEAIWAGISALPEQLWIILILAQLRQGISEEELIAMLPEPYRLSFLSYFPRIRYLLASEDLISIYHQSFSYFVQSKGALQRKTANDFVLAWCRANADNEYSATNLLFHLMQSTHPIGAVGFCDQQWADRCAIFDVEPELVLEDIRATIRLAADEKMTVDVIRLFLLLERIAFRYDEVFADQAGVLALSLISMGKFRQAMRYLVREHELLVSLGDANMFLQLLTEKNATKEAKMLFEAIGIKFRRQFVKEQENQGDNIFDLLHLRAVSAMIIQDLEGRESKIELNWIVRILMRGAMKAGKEGRTDAQNSILYVIKVIGSTTAGYALRAFEQYRSPREFAEFSQQTLDSSWTVHYARQILAFRDFQQYNTKVISDSVLYRSLVADTTELLEKLGYENVDDYQKQIIEALMPVCAKPALLEPLIMDYLAMTIEQSTIRRVEGVEIDFNAVRELLFNYTCRGYLNPSSDYPDLHGMDDWEQGLIGLIKNIAFLEGRLYHKRVAGAAYSDEIVKFKRFVQELDLTLDNRSQWDRAYAIPEALVPVLFARCVRLMAGFFATEVTWFIERIVKRRQGQLGLYTEGFRRCLQNSIEELLMAEIDKKFILPLIEILESHVLIAVQNRRERTPELLRVVEFYNLVGETEKASTVYQQMLFTSMGPDWYKEAQFDVLDTVLGIRNGDAGISSYLQKFAGLLDFASGEMTFQRYIRADKEAFAKSLVAKGFAVKGMGYIQFELVPPPQIVIFNAEHFTIDMPRPGDGYFRGGRNIREEYMVMRLLSVEMSPLLRFALSAIFILNDDIDRFFPEYPKAMCTSIEKLHQEGMDISPLCELIVGITEDSEMMPFRARLLSIFQEEASTAVLAILQTTFAKKGIHETLEAQGLSRRTATSAPIATEENAFDRFNLACEVGVEQRDDLLRMGFNAFTTEKVGVWFFGYSSASTEARKHLKKLLHSDADLWPYIKEHIVEYSTNHWNIANSLIWFVQEVLNTSKTAEIYSIVAEHFSLLVRPEEAYFDKYAWLGTDLPFLTIDNSVARFLIWLLGYPLDIYRRRASSAITTILRLDPSLFLGLLIDEIIALQPGPSCHQAAILLCHFAEEQPAVVGQFLDTRPSLVSQVAGVTHFSVRYTLYQMSKALRDTGYPSLFTVLEKAIPDHVETGMSVAFSEPPFDAIQEIIDELDNRDLLNGAFCRSMEKLIRSYCEPLSLVNFIKADRYLLRSFTQHDQRHSKYRGLLHFALNMSITPRVDKGRLGLVYELINR